MDLLLAADAGLEAGVEAFIQSAHSVNTKYRNSSSTGFNRGGTALMYAARSGHLRIATRLLEAGADVNIVDAENWNALHYACFSGHTAVTVLLLQHGCNPCIVTTHEKATPDGFATYRRFFKLVRVAFPHVAQPNALTASEQKDCFKKCRDKLHVDSEEPFLYRYLLSKTHRQSIYKFVSEGVNRVPALPAAIHLAGVNDTMLNCVVDIFMSACVEERDAFACAARGSQRHVFMSSSISTVQHFVVVSASDKGETTPHVYTTQ